MNNSSSWADLWVEEASGSSSVLWYHDLLNDLLMAWHGLSGNAGAFRNHTHGRAISSVLQFFNWNLSIFLIHITQNLSSNLSTHTLWHITYFTWTICALYTIYPFKQYLLSVSFCPYFDLTRHGMVYNAIIWLWAYFTALRVSWWPDIWKQDTESKLPCYTDLQSGNKWWIRCSVFLCWKQEWSYMNINNQ